MDADPDSKEAAERVGRSFGKWQLESVLGTGGMAAVYSARTPEGARAAIKVLHRELVKSEELRRRFAQEGTAASRVGHPGVVDVLGSGEEPDGTCYLVLELLEGEPFGRLLRREDEVAVPRLLEVLDQVLDVLAAAHAKGIIHRDLKPDNLFVTREGKIKVLDFGIARMLEGAPAAYQTRVGVTLGTVAYMSPEQALGKRDQVDGRSDIFALGAMAFRLLARRNIHEARTDADLLLAMATRAAPPLLTIAPGVPQGLAAIVDVALAYSKDSRYPDARTMQADVRAVAAGGEPPFATAHLRRREMSTRVDLPVPQGTGPASAPPSGLGTAPASAPASSLQTTRHVVATGAATVRAGPSAAPGRTVPMPAVSAPPSGTAATERNFTPPSVRAPESAPPSTATAQRRREAWNERPAAPTVEQAAYETATAPMAARPDLLADGPTMQSTPPPTLAGTAQAKMNQGAAPAPVRSRGKLYAAAAVLALSGGALAYAFGVEHSPDAPEAAAATPSSPAAPVAPPPNAEHAATTPAPQVPAAHAAKPSSHVVTSTAHAAPAAASAAPAAASAAPAAASAAPAAASAAPATPTATATAALTAATATATATSAPAVAISATPLVAPAPAAPSATPAPPLPATRRSRRSRHGHP